MKKGPKDEKRNIQKLLPALKRQERKNKKDAAHRGAGRVAWRFRLQGGACRKEVAKERTAWVMTKKQG